MCVCVCVYQSINKHFSLLVDREMDISRLKCL